MDNENVNIGGERDYPDQPVGKGGDKSSASQPFRNEYSQISNPDEAEVIAYVEKDQGKDAALLREKALQKEHETGMTEQERENLEIANMLIEEFPDAFVEQVDKNGTEMYTTGLSIVQFWSLIDGSLLSIPEKRNLRKKYDKIAYKIGNYNLSQSKVILTTLVSHDLILHVSKYGLSMGCPEWGYRPIKGGDSIKIFSDDELKTFFEALKFLDKVGKIRKEIDVDKKRRERSAEDFRNLAQQIKGTPTS